MRDGSHDTNYSYPRVCLLQRLWGGRLAECDAPHAPVFLRPQPRLLTPQARWLGRPRPRWGGAALLPAGGAASSGQPLCASAWQPPLPAPPLAPPANDHRM